MTLDNDNSDLRCARTVGVNILHSPRMFQARPTDYPAAQISNRRPISFHKHWNIDPLQVYEEYFKSSDKILAQSEHKQELWAGLIWLVWPIVLLCCDVIIYTDLLIIINLEVSK